MPDYSRACLSRPGFHSLPNNMHQHESNNNIIPGVPGYCICGRVAGRTGKCATCEYEARRMEKKSEAQPKKYQRVRPRSKKRMADEAIYRKESREWLVGKKCAVYRWKDATECHHKKGRQGFADQYARDNGIPLLLDKRFWLPLSKEAHDKATEDSAWAIQNGISELRSN